MGFYDTEAQAMELTEQYARSWHISLGLINVPEHYYVDRNKPVEEPVIRKHPSISMTKQGNKHMIAAIEKLINDGMNGRQEIYKYLYDNNILPEINGKKMAYITVYNYINSIRGKLRKPRKSKIDFTIELFESGMSPKDISLQLGIDERYANSILYTAGLIQKQRQRRSA